MADLLTVLAAVEGEESSKLAFYVLGGAFAAWAVLLGAAGTRRPSLPGGDGAAKAIMGISALLAVGACVSAVLTA